MTVVDNFGDHVPVASAAATDDGSKGSRVWRWFELAGDELTDSHPSPWVLVAPTVVGDLTGEPLERVSLVRDEGANLVWGIERLVEGPAGRSLDRAMLGSGAPAVSASAPPTTDGQLAPLRYDDQVWSYRLESDVPPPFWIPFLPERIARGSAEIRLRRARMQQWEAGDGGRARSARRRARRQPTVLDPRGGGAALGDPGRPTMAIRAWGRRRRPSLAAAGEVSRPR